MTKRWVSYKLYFRECRECGSMIECLKNSKKCLANRKEDKIEKYL